MGCGQTQNSSDQSTGQSGHSEQSGYNSDTGTDNNSIVYDCIKSDLQTQHHGQEHHQPHHPRNHPSVRSVHSLSNKYSENKKYNIRKNASMCVRSEKVSHVIVVKYFFDKYFLNIFYNKVFNTKIFESDATFERRSAASPATTTDAEQTENPDTKPITCEARKTW